MCLALLAVPCASAPAEAQAPDPGTAINREYDLKAVFLYKFGHYVRWPGPAFARPEDPFVIGVIGTDPFGNVLDRIAATQKVEGRPIAIRRWRAPEEVGPCHVLFVPRSLEPQRRQAALAAAQGRQVLTVGEAPEFCRQGGVVSFFIAENNLRFEVSLANAKREQLTVSSSLLKLARLADDE